VFVQHGRVVCNRRAASGDPALIVRLQQMWELKLTGRED
jgi:hypothetical protein